MRNRTERLFTICGGAMLFATILGLFVDPAEFTPWGVAAAGLACWLLSWTIVRRIEQRGER